jgi:hypothetical protein
MSGSRIQKKAPSLEAYIYPIINLNLFRTDLFRGSLSQLLFYPYMLNSSSGSGTHFFETHHWAPPDGHLVLFIAVDVVLDR